MWLSPGIEALLINSACWVIMQKAAAVTPGTKGIIVITVAAIYGALIMSPLLLNTIPGDLLIPILQMRKQGTDQGKASRPYSLKVAFSGFKPRSSRPKLVIFFIRPAASQVANTVV